MNLPELLADLESRGVKLSVRLVVDAPNGALTAEHKAALAEYKSPLLVTLAKEHQWNELAPQRWGPALGSKENTSSPCDPQPETAK